MKLRCRNKVALLVMMLLIFGMTGVTPKEACASTAETGEVNTIKTEELSAILASLQKLLSDLQGYVRAKNTSPAVCASEWKSANMTWFTSYPEPGSEECTAYNGCTWEGLFAGVHGKQTETWVAAHNIAAVHEDFFDRYKNKSLSIRDRETGKSMEVQVLDMCADSDCNDCCTRNMKETGFLIDLEKYTAERFLGEYPSNATIDWCVTN